jgi:hypothetical protein
MSQDETDPIKLIEAETGFYDEIEYEPQVTVSGKALWELLQECKRWRASHASEGFNPDWCAAGEALREHLTAHASAQRVDGERALAEELDNVQKALEGPLNVFRSGPPGGSITYDAEWRQDWIAKFTTALLSFARIRRSIPTRQAGWMPIEKARKDRTPILLKMKDDLSPFNKGDDDWNARWAGIQFVGQHPGVAKDGFDSGWGFAAPVGHGGIPDAWIEGWQPLPSSPRGAQPEEGGR